MNRIAPILALLLLSALSSACVTDPMSYARWKAEQKKRAEMEARGLEYKSPAQIREEVRQMRESAKDVRFEPTGAAK